jgi:glycine cleavage system H protein
MAYPSDRKYTREHEWIRVEGDSAEIGITDYAQRQLGDVVFVELPEVGRTLTAGAVFGQIDSVKATSELFSPATGEVTATNPELKEHPEAVNAKPHDTWFVRLRLSDRSALDSLLDSAQYEELVRQA